MGITEDIDGNIWAACAGNPRKLVRIRDFEVREEFPTSQVPAARTLAPDPQGGIWIATTTGDLARFRNGAVEKFALNLKGNPFLRRIVANADGSVLAASEDGLVGLRQGKVQRMTTENGLPCSAVFSFVEDKEKRWWLYTDCGVLELADSELQRWWSDPGALVQTRIYDRLDGAQPNAPYFNSAAYSPDGRVWFANGQVVQMVDPSTLSRKAPPAPTYIESVIVDRREFPATGNLGLAPQPRDLQIDYTSPTFTVPQKVKFRYRLDSYDSDWHDAGTRRQAFYTDLPPGSYTFRVIAANSDGVWNETPAKLDFSIAPAYFQTNWFRALCAGLFLAMLWMAYRLRVRHLQRRFETTLLAEEKLREKDDALEMARTELARVSRLTTLGELTTSIAHEVSQPLGAMVASAGACARWLAADPPAMAEARSALDNIVADGKRAREVIARIRALTKRQAPRMDLLDLNREILEVLALTEQELRSHDIVLETKLDRTLPQVTGDRVQLQQVLLNLILNAIEAMSAVDDRPRELTIVSAQDTRGVVVEVRDSGIGLDQDHAERVFDAFYTTKAEGLGIGLSISRSIIEAHGGQLWAAPNQPHGAVFGFSLPRTIMSERLWRSALAKAGLRPPVIPESQLMPPVSQTAAQCHERARVVFVVDDDPSMRRSLETLLRSVGLDARLFSSAQEFMQAERPDAPGCLVLDVRLPGMSGLTFQQELAKAGVALPVIFITGHGDVPMTVRAMKAGAAEFLTKPFDDQVLLDAIHAAIERDRARRRDAASLAVLKARYDELTQRERQVMKLVVAGRVNKQIAAELGLSLVTVKVHRGQVMRKMLAKSVAELVRMADRLGASGAA